MIKIKVGTEKWQTGWGIIDEATGELLCFYKTKGEALAEVLHDDPSVSLIKVIYRAFFIDPDEKED